MREQEHFVSAPTLSLWRTAILSRMICSYYVQLLPP
jgi:hypothetical protein